MKAGNPMPDPLGARGAWRWDVKGSFRGSDGTWQLVVHPQTNTIYHFNFVSKPK